jgi:uncharacterized protein YdhG (YjbR/CyaY superfamily)
VPEDARTLLERLRATIRAAAPEAVETIAYQMPAFRQDGRFLVSYAAFKEHCSLFPASDGVVAACGEELSSHLSGKGTIRFTVDDPLSDELVTTIVETRIEEVRREVTDAD